MGGSKSILCKVRFEYLVSYLGTNIVPGSGCSRELAPASVAFSDSTAAVGVGIGPDCVCLSWVVWAVRILCCSGRVTFSFSGIC